MKIHKNDNVEVRADGQKYALTAIEAGEPVIKYGYPIGKATGKIAAGEKVSPANLHSALSGTGEWQYRKAAEITPPGEPLYFDGYLRKDGSAGIRNGLWIIPTVGCVNGVARALTAKCGATALTHSYGCSQLGDDLLCTRHTLAALAKHPNAGGVLLLGLGCENNTMDEMRAALGDYDPERVRFLTAQEVEDECAAGERLLAELAARISADKKQKIPFSALRIGVKCGGSDGYSGITANPAVGRVSDAFYAAGADVLMCETPEIFGAEELLLSRAKSEAVFEECGRTVRGFRQYFINHREPISENPSPGNIAGGITTLEEKSLGCVQKAGQLPLCGTLTPGDKPANGQGLYLVPGPGNDMVSSTLLAAAGAQLILFTTGRGTPFVSPVPTLKIASNNALAAKKPHWIDFNAGVLTNGETMERTAAELFSLCRAVLGGALTAGERNGYADIALFKNGVTL